MVGAVIVSVWVDELFEVTGSVWSADTVAVLVTIPGVPGNVRTVIVAVPPFAIVPSRQVTVPPASEQDPCVVFTERYVTTEGRVSVTVTFVADAGPLLLTANE